jgi:triosephosphate isomerase
MKPRKPFVVGNWKMNGDLVANEHLFTALRSAIDRQLLAQADCAVCPPFPYLGQAAAWLGDTGIEWGAQNVSSFDNGAFTGEVSAAMLAELGCRWAIVGHSERRTLLGEDDATVAQKAARVLARDLGVIVCVGETLEEREGERTEQVLARQVDALAALAPGARADRFVVAYEPVWAIGTGRTASPEQAQAAHLFIRQRLAAIGVAQAAQVRILYGGSVKASNAAGLFTKPDIDGGLIGGASLVADDFVAILRAAAVA